MHGDRGTTRDRVEILTVGEVTIADLAYGAPTGRVPPAARAADVVCVSLLCDDAPGVTVRVRDRNVRVAGTAILLTGRDPGRGCEPPRVRQVRVTVPRITLALGPRRVDRALRHPVVPPIPVVEALVRPMLAGMRGRLHLLSSGADDDLARTWISTVTLLLRALADRAPLADEELVERVHRFVDRHIADADLGPDRIAAALHVSRRRLYQLLEHEGVGIAESIRDARLWRAAEMLVDPAHRRSTIAEIGCAVGLPRSDHFSRLVRARFGCSPRDLRARGRLPG